MVQLALALLMQVPLPACPPAWTPLPNDACLLEGDRPGLAVYFHGMTQPSLRALHVELGLVERVPRDQRTSFVVLKGRSGLCDWAPEYRDYWCWPTARSRLPDVRQVAARLREVLASAADLLGEATAAHPLVAGYSNGAYLLTMLMGDVEVPAAGWVLMHGGPVTGASFPSERARPTLLLAAADDGIQRPAMEALKGKLDEAHWPSTLVTRAGGHPPVLEDYERLFDFAAAVSHPP